MATIVVIAKTEVRNQRLIFIMNVAVGSPGQSDVLSQRMKISDIFDKRVISEEKRKTI